ncbi:MAG: hypothetical protein KGR24_09335 [Planctomycetes bacterium]|nr:hypothetical protein [Planctomycetota bacterium]
MADDAAKVALDAIAANLAQPKRARTDAGEVEQHDLEQQVMAAKFVQEQTKANSAGSPFASLRRARISYPGATD